MRAGDVRRQKQNERNKQMAKDIVIKGAKENNLKNVDRDDPAGTSW